MQYPVYYLSTQYHRHLQPSTEATSIWDRDWDLLVILDACRMDWLQEVEDDYQFIDEVDYIWSVAGHSQEFMKSTFTDQPDEYLQDTAYISGNHYTETVEDEPFCYLDDVSEVNFGEFASPPAHIVTDRAVKAGRSYDCDRLIVHYMQPHKPFFERVGGRDDITVKEWSTGWNLYEEVVRGHRTKQDIWDGYLENLRHVLDEVGLLLENINADKTVLTADHGNALGESYLWDHPHGVQHRATRQVPWVETTATDERTVSPQEYSSTEVSDEQLEKRLKQLGYR